MKNRVKEVRMIRRTLNAGLFLSLCAWTLAGCQLTQPTLHVAEIQSVPKPNRLIEINTVWAEAKPLKVKVQTPGIMPGVMNDEGARTVTLRAVHDGRAISVLAIWDDPTESRDRSMWVWNDDSNQYFRLDTPCDLFAMKFCIEGAEDACMMSGGEGVYDVWEWRGGWTHLTGYAEDQVLRITRTRPDSGQFKQYPIGGPAAIGSGLPTDSIYIHWMPDKGDLPYQWVPRPKRRERAVMNAIRAQQPTESTGDVLAEAVYQNGGWALELYRTLTTGNDDDYAIKAHVPHMFSIAITDGQEGAQHLTSNLIRMKLE